MKIVLCDYPVDLARDLSYEIDRLKAVFPEAEIVTYEYRDEKKAEFIELMEDADAAINTYVTFDREVLSRCKRLRCVAVNGMGYNMMDVEAATEAGVYVCPVAEYCTDEVAEHTMALIFALCRGLRKFISAIENHVWDYTSAGRLDRINGKTITIFGFGKIGRAVASRCQAMGMQVQVVSRSLKPETAKELGVKLVDTETALRTSDILSNHLSMNEQNAGYFTEEKFRMAKEKKPVFINTGRGGTVVEEDLIQALDRGWISAAGLDVLSSENVDFSKLPFLGRDNVILTPHAAFYSEQSARALQDIACETVIGVLTGDLSRVSKIVNPEAGRK